MLTSPRFYVWKCTLQHFIQFSLLTSNPNQTFAGPSSKNGGGTARKMMGSPRALENAVPTAKNPHGVWV